MVRHRHWDLDIGAALMDLALVVGVGSAGAEVSAEAFGQALDGVVAMGEVSAGVELTLHGEPGSVMRC